jgi:hypothetical protein
VYGQPKANACVSWLRCLLDVLRSMNQVESLGASGISPTDAMAMPTESAELL